MNEMNDSVPGTTLKNELLTYNRDYKMREKDYKEMLRIAIVSGLLLFIILMALGEQI
jgi:hypothetical protein